MAVSKAESHGYRFDQAHRAQETFDQIAPLPASLVETDSFGIPTPTTPVMATGDNNIDGLLSGVKWASNSLSFSFTDSIDDYEFNYANRDSHAASFQMLNAEQQAVAREWIGNGGEFYNVSSLVMSDLTGSNDYDATLRLAMSNDPFTAYAYYPSGTSVEAGDAWFNPFDYNAPVIGNYAYHTFGHELGHALGLKHGHETGGVKNVAMNADRDSMEFSIMTYRSYEGHDLNALPYYTNETWGFAQSLMMYDIRAIQEMYGAWFGYNSGDTVYTFSTTTGEMSIDNVGQGVPGANRVFRTIWDGDGIDTYDFSNYTTKLAIDLAPGGWSDLSVGGNFQRAKLNDGYGGITQYARGHVFNALQYNGDARSLIENAKGGSKGDTISGNTANNYLYGNGSNDFLNGFAGSDFLYGGSGVDALNGGDSNDYVNGGAGADTMDGGDYDDTYIVDNALDVAAEVFGDALGGIDTVQSSVTHTLSQNLENLTLTGSATINGTGNARNNTLIGNGAANVISGLAGSDAIQGKAGQDALIGGTGADTLTGGTGADFFDFNTKSEGIDTISDFSVIDDTIRVSASGFGGGLTAGAVITAAQFFIGAGAADSSDRFIYNSGTGALFFDVDGIGGAAKTRIATLSVGLALTNNDIFVTA